jgi:hypothetical protein
MQNCKKKIARRIIFLFLLYVASYWLILANPFSYWDGLLISTINSQSLIDNFRQTGFPWIGYFHLIILKYLGGIIFYRIFTVILYFLSGIALLVILDKIKQISISCSLKLVLFFLILPVNFARISIINFPSALCYFLFFLAFFFFTKFIENKNLYYRYLSLIFFFVSFTTNSLLCFYYGILSIYILYIMIYQKRRKIFRFIFNKIDFIILPILFFWIKLSFFPSYGRYSGYNNVSTTSISNSILDTLFQIEKLFLFFISPFYPHLHCNMAMYFLIAVILCILLYLLSKKYIKRDINRHVLQNTGFIVIGLILLYISIFPYTVVSGVINYGAWTNRHQLLTPIGVAFLFVGFINLLFAHNRFKLFIYSFIIASFIIVNNIVFFQFILDGIKQELIMNTFSKSKIIRNNSTFCIIDKAKSFDALGRYYRFYEYSSFSKKVFDDETKLFYAPPKWSIEWFNKYKEKLIIGENNLKDYTSNGNIEYTITITEGLKPSMFEIFHYIFDDFYKNKLSNNLKKMIIFKIEKNN